jgi:hypothetical protein
MERQRFRGTEMTQDEKMELFNLISQDIWKCFGEEFFAYHSEWKRQKDMLKKIEKKIKERLDALQ